MLRISRIRPLFMYRNVAQNRLLSQITSTTDNETNQTDEIDLTKNEISTSKKEIPRFDIINVANIKPEDFPISTTGDGFNFKEAYSWRSDFLSLLKKEEKVEEDEGKLPLKLRLLEKERLTQIFESQYPGLYNIIKKIKEPKELEVIEEKKQVYFPFRMKNELTLQDESKEIAIHKKVEDRLEAVKKMGDRLMTFLKSKTDPKDLELQHEIDYFRDNICKANYSHPDPSIPKSNVPCGGCGAHLHCQDQSLPGYMPTDKYVLLEEKELVGELCQRCLYLQTLNVALKLNVDSKDYPRLISHIRKQKALVILMVDLLDFPNSIWPGIVQAIGHDKPIFVVGNKVDLLPNDNFEENEKYLNRVRKSIEDYLIACGIDTGHNIKRISLISAKTGFGVEELITKVQEYWNKKGHVYLVGSVNAGKSSLFNAFLQSDFCKADACDMVQRATVSPWPGTTLNLLKFPIMQPTEFELNLRQKRLFNVYRQKYIEGYLRKSLYYQTRNHKYLTMIGRIGMTYRNDFKNYEDEELAGLEPVTRKEMPVSKYLNLALPDRRNFFCYDTPGTVFSDQIIDLLTSDEVQKAIPRETIVPRLVNLMSGQSLFVGGLARLDLLDVEHYGPLDAPLDRRHVKFTVFCSKYLPINVVPISQAELFYSIYVQAGMLVVPSNDPQRLADLPPFLGKDFNMEGIGFRQSCGDIVLSSAGWISLTTREGWKVKLRAYTPEGRGIFKRTPALHPFSINFKHQSRGIKPPKFELDKLPGYAPRSYNNNNNARSTNHYRDSYNNNDNNNGRSTNHYRDSYNNNDNNNGRSTNHYRDSYNNNDNNNGRSTNHHRDSYNNNRRSANHHRDNQQ